MKLTILATLLAAGFAEEPAVVSELPVLDTLAGRPFLGNSIYNRFGRGVRPIYNPYRGVAPVTVPAPARVVNDEEVASARAALKAVHNKALGYQFKFMDKDGFRFQGDATSLAAKNAFGTLGSLEHWKYNQGQKTNAYNDLLASGNYDRDSVKAAELGLLSQQYDGLVKLNGGVLGQSKKDLFQDSHASVAEYLRTVTNAVAAGDKHTVNSPTQYDLTAQLASGLLPSTGGRIRAFNSYLSSAAKEAIAVKAAEDAPEDVNAQLKAESAAYDKMKSMAAVNLDSDLEAKYEHLKWQKLVEIAENKLAKAQRGH